MIRVPAAKKRRASLLILLASASVGLAAEKKPRHAIVSVHSRTDGSYQRAKLADGTFEPEYFAISNGGAVAGTTRDSAQDRMDVSVIAKAVAGHLATQNYFLAPDAKSAELLLVVQWGRTIPFNDVNYGDRVGQVGSALSRVQDLNRAGPASTSASSPEQAAAAAGSSSERIQSQMQAMDEMNAQLFAMQMENDVRDQRNLTNAQLLGYLDAINDANDVSRFAGNVRYDELRADIEEPRYYIIISAYDFRLLTEKKQHKLRWVTRISIRAQGNRFGDRVDEMVARAARYFGADSGKLIREYEGTVEMGELEVIGVVDEPETDTLPPSEEPAAPDRAQ